MSYFRTPAVNAPIPQQSSVCVAATESTCIYDSTETSRLNTSKGIFNESVNLIMFDQNSLL